MFIHISIYYSWLLFSDVQESTYLLVENLISWLAPVVAFITLFIVSRKFTGKINTFWSLLALGCFSFTIAEGIWVYSHNVSHVEPAYPGWPEPFYFLHIIFYLVAFAYYLKSQKEIAYQIKFVFDLMIIAAVTTALSWHFIIQLMIPSESVSPLLFIISIGYPLLDLLLLFSVISLYIGYPSAFPPRVLALIITGLTLQVFADTLYLYSTVADTYSSGSLYDPLWSLSLLLVALSGVYALEPGTNKVPKKELLYPNDRISIRMLLPYFSLLVMFIVIMVVQPTYTKGLIAGAFIATALIVTRQIFTLRDNRRLLLRYDQLTTELEHKVQQRTVEVTSKNEELKTAVQQMKHVAYHDALTGLPNRKLFLENLESSLIHTKETSQKVAVAFIDLDRFKNINDTFGHEFGDLLLQAFSNRLTHVLGTDRESVSRQGGDEFTFFLPGVRDTVDIERTIDKLQAAFASPLSVKEHSIYTFMSIGVAVYPDDAQTSDELLKYADTAMYKAKARGKNNFQFFTPDMASTLSEKIDLENELRRAIDHNEFTLHYQPQMQVSTGDIIGVEALIRWQTPDGRIISPGDFIPLAEETRQIFSIGKWVLYTACMQAKQWHDAGYSHLKLAVNLSPLQFLDDNLTDLVEQVLSDTGFPATSLELEITENVAVDDTKTALRQMQSLQKLGVHFAIDDFGTGYCSLNYLKKFPLNNLKIALPFVQDMVDNPQNKAIVEAMIFIGHSLNMSVVAEGVETEEQFVSLKELGCDEIQGYFFSKPLTAPLLTWLLTQKASYAKSGLQSGIRGN